VVTKSVGKLDWSPRKKGGEKITSREEVLKLKEDDGASEQKER